MSEPGADRALDSATRARRTSREPVMRHFGGRGLRDRFEDRADTLVESRALVGRDIAIEHFAYQRVKERDVTRPSLDQDAGGEGIADGRMTVDAVTRNSGKNAK